MKKHEANAAVIVDAALWSSAGNDTDSLRTALLAAHPVFETCTRFKNPVWNHAKAALFPAETAPGTDTRTLPERMIAFLAETARRFPAETELILATTVGEIEELDNPHNRCTLDSLLEKTKSAFGYDSGRILSAACASSNVALDRARALIETGKRRFVAVAAMDYVSEFVFSGFACISAMSPTYPRPYDTTRDGLLLGDAAGLLILTSLDEAQKHALPVRAVLSGSAVTCDADHITAPTESGEYLALAIKATLERAGRAPCDVGAVIGHGTGTIYNDAMELNALTRIFGTGPLPLFSVKALCGHTLGAAGMVQACAALEMLRTATIPPQTGLTVPESAAALRVSDAERKLEKPCVLSMNSGFGGINATLLLEELRS